jgi:hypothetical protein
MVMNTLFSFGLFNLQEIWNPVSSWSFTGVAGPLQLCGRVCSLSPRFA